MQEGQRVHVAESWERDGIGTDSEQFVRGKLRCFSLYQDPKQHHWPLP